VDLETADFNASGVFDRTNLNYVRQFIGGTCQDFLPQMSGVPSPVLSPLIATGDDGLRSVCADFSHHFLAWMDYLYFPKENLLPKGITQTTTGWLRKTAHTLS